MYGKLFKQMYDGTLATKGPWQALVTFQQLVILADRHGCIDMTAEAIARRTTVPSDVIETGLRALGEPDPDSRSPAEEGRRIVPIDPSRSWGWRVVNYGHYRKIRSEEERREDHRNYMRARRSGVKKVVKASTDGEQSQPIAVSSRKNTSAGKPASAKLYPAEFLSLFNLYPRRDGDNPKTRAYRAYRARLAEGHPHAELLAGVERYAAWVRARGKEGTELVKQLATFLGPDKAFLQPWVVQSFTPQCLAI